MAESMHLDSADLDGSLDGFENLEHISGDFNMEDTKVILPHSDDGMDLMDVHPKEIVTIIKEEVIDKMDDDTMIENSEDMTSVIDKVDVGEILTVQANEELTSSQDLFNQDIIEEVVGHDEQDSKMYEDMETLDQFVEEEVISENAEHLEEIVTEDVISEETVIDESHVQEQSEPMFEEVVKSEPVPVSTKMVTPGVYVVATSNSNIVSAQSFLPKAAGGTRLLMSSGEGAAPGQTIRILATGPSQEEVKPQVTSTPHTIRIVASSSGASSANKVMRNTTGTTRTITLAEARQMGLITSAKLNSLLPTNILPKPNTSGAIKTSTVVSSNTTGSQVIRIPAGQSLSNLHQIQLPGNKVQYVKLVGTGKGNQSEAGSSTKTIPVAFTGSLLNPQQTPFKLLSIATALGGSQKILIPANSQPVVSGSSNSAGNLVVLPSHLIQAATSSSTTTATPISIKKPQQLLESKTPTPVEPAPTKATSRAETSSPASPTSSPTAPVSPTPIKTKEVIVAAAGGTGALSLNSGDPPVVIKTEPDTVKEPWSPEQSPPPQTFEPNGIRPRKPCNCTKSMCLKLYCDCFANGEFCHQCNCTCCYNNLEHEEERQRAIKLCLERNPSAFRPKIGKSYIGSEERRHNKGCNCRRSGCLKNYCECYEAKIPCNKNCKCIGCKNVDSPFVLRRDDDPRVMTGASSGGTLLRLIKAERESAAARPHHPSPAYLSSIKQAYRMMSNEVVEATCQCLLAQAEDWERENIDQMEGTPNSPSLDVAQSLVLEEFSRCLVQIVDCVTKSTASIQGMT